MSNDDLDTTCTCPIFSGTKFGFGGPTQHLPQCPQHAILLHTVKEIDLELGRGPEPLADLVKKYFGHVWDKGKCIYCDVPSSSVKCDSGEVLEYINPPEWCEARICNAAVALAHAEALGKARPAASDDILFTPLIKLAMAMAPVYPLKEQS